MVRAAGRSRLWTNRQRRLTDDRAVPRRAVCKVENMRVRALAGPTLRAFRGTSLMVSPQLVLAEPRNLPRCRNCEMSHDYVRRCPSTTSPQLSTTSPVRTNRGHGAVIQAGVAVTDYFVHHKPGTGRKVPGAAIGDIRRIGKDPQRRQPSRHRDGHAAVPCPPSARCRMKR